MAHGAPQRIPAHDDPGPGFVPPPDREQRSRSYRWLMHLGLPLAASLAIHVLVIALLGLKHWEVGARPGPQVGEYEAGLVPRLENQAAQTLDWPEPAPLETPPREPADPGNRPGDLDPLAALAAPELDELLAPGGPGRPAGPGLQPGEAGLGAGELRLLGTGGGAGGIGTGGFGSGLGGRGDTPRQAGIWNVRVRADAVVYVVDFSGSIIVAVQELKRELKRSIGRLEPAQLFNVIIFYSETAGGSERYMSEAFAPRLQPATEETRRALFAWLDAKTPNGRTEPLPSLRRALAMKPQAVFFFSDGLFDDAVVDAVTQANRDVGARIYCFVFDELLLQDLSGLPRETEGSRRLRRIAEQNGGQVKVVTGADLAR